ncbi:MAG: alkaline phosphatase family protein [Caldilineaceae bacterium]|nr:alkaline phosphatase family protein [Caldilineaceae bacterium]
MKSPARRAILIGMDGASMELVYNMVDGGHMPHLGKLLDRGAHRPMIGVFPTLTPPGWTATSTGAWPGNHSVMDFNIRKLGGRLDETVWGINTDLSQAEYLWNTVERAGGTPLLVKWEMSWPPTVTSGVQVEGTGPGVSNHHQIAGYHLFVAGNWQRRSIEGQRDPETLDPSALQTVSDVDSISVSDAVGWSNLPPSSRTFKEVPLTIQPLVRGRGSMLRGEEGTPKPFYGLIYAGGESGYDRVRICRTRDAADPIAELAVGEWTDWWLDSFEIDGEGVEGYMRMKLVNLTPEADAFELFVPQIWPALGYTEPPEVAAELDEHVGNFLQNPGRDALGIIDDDTYFELLDFHHERLVDVAGYLTATRADWTMLFIETHASDYTSHFFLGQADDLSGADKETQQRSLDGVIRTYASIDDMIGRIVQLAGEDTLVCLVSDHGGTPNQFRSILIEEALEEAGLLVYGEENGRRTVDWSRTSAAPVGLVHVFINLQGREPTGIVPVSDYEETQLAIIDALHAYTDPESGRHPFALAVTRADAEMVNLWGDTVGDVVYALRPEFDGAHGKQLPSVSFGIAGQHCTFVLAGPGVKEGITLRGQVRAVDVAPTLCYLLGLPMPRNVEGGVVYEALTDPDWHLNS